MRITITGASGFVGTRLLTRLLADGHKLEVLGRRKPRADAGFTPWDALDGEPRLPPSDAVVHLAGEPVAQRWTPNVKRRIRDSRVEGTKALVAAMARLDPRPATLICASAVGYYGNRGDETLTETSPPGRGFLPETCVGWESAAESASQHGIRVVRLRIGVVLGREGGALAKMLPAFRLGAGGPLGSGRQWMPWIHADDLLGLIQFALQTQTSGAVNACAPNPVTNREFTKTLGAVLHRPAILPVPEFGLRLLFGEMAEILLDSQRVIPAAALAAGYRFAHPDLKNALAAAL